MLKVVALGVLCVVVALACQSNDVRPYPGTCHSYLDCADGKYVKKSCPSYKRYWDTNTTRCAYWEAVCGNVECVEEAKEEYPEGNGCQYYLCVDGKRVEKECPEGEKFDPHNRVCSSSFVCAEHRRVYINCKNYKECVNNTWINKQCPWGHKFDEVSLKCVLWGAHCSDV